MGDARAYAKSFCAFAVVNGLLAIPALETVESKQRRFMTIAEPVRNRDISHAQAMAT
jgi:hypothetical protein